MADITQSSTAAKSGPVKLRAACNQCNAAKVKCSGEKTGCGRCTVLKVDCIFMESRVGRVPGTRAKKAKPSGTRPSTSDSSTLCETQNQNINRLKPMWETSFDDVITNWPTDLLHPMDYDAASLDGNMEMFTNSYNAGESSTSGVSHEPSVSMSGPSSSPDTDVPVPSHKFASSTLVSPASTDASFAGLSGAQPSTSQCAMLGRRAKQKSETESQHVLACTQIITSLENYIIADLKALDIVLGIVQKAVNMLNHLINLQQDSRSFRCQALFCVIMHQIIELLESGCACFLVKNTDRTSSELEKLAALGSSPSPAGFGFGSFQFDVQVDRTWRAEIVLKELQQSSEVLQRIITLARLSRDTEERDPSHVELERRLDALSQEVRNARSV